MRSGLVLALAGCGRMAFEPELVPGTVSHGCFDPGEHAAFDRNGPSDCSPWGSATEKSAALVEQGSALLVQPSRTDGSAAYAGCYHQPMPLGPGVFVEVGTPLDPGTAPSAYTIFQVYGVDSATSIGFVVTSAGVELYDLVEAKTLATVPFDPAAASWWRLRADPNGLGMIGELSPDGETWTVMAALDAPVPTMVSVNLGAGTNAFEPNAGSAEFLGVDICP